MEEGELPEESSKNEERKERRQRKKLLINEVQIQLEFYFSSANLRKDLFLQELLSRSPYIEVEVFKRFNKLKQLSTDTKILQKAIRKSTTLELSKDGLRVRRNSPLEEKVNEEECTVYAENLPPLVSHEWIRKVFGQYGAIDYVSLPRFKQSNKPKGFAFIEYHTPQEAQQAVIGFGGLAALDDNINPADLLSIKTYSQVDNAEQESESLDQKTIEGQEVQLAKGAKRSYEEAFVGNGVKGVKKDDDEPHHSKKSKKKRKRSKKEKEYEVDSIYLRVMSKKSWKKLRNKYLDLQKVNMSQLKHFNTSYRNSQRDQQGYSDETPDATKKPNSSEPIFNPGVIVKMVLKEIPDNCSAFRKSLQNAYISIAYIDISEGGKNVYLRFKSPDTASDFVNRSGYENVDVLADLEEKLYWDLIKSSWLERHQKRLDGNKKPMGAKAKANIKGKHKLIKKSLDLTNNADLAAHLVYNE